MRRIWAEVKANHARLKACPCHSFEPLDDAKNMLLRKVRCIRCDGTMDRSDAMHYTRGFKAAGGNPETVWPGVGVIL